MALSTRPMSKPPGGSNPSGTPGPPRILPSRADISALIAGDNGPIKNSRDACRFLETKGWILAAEPYDRTKLVRVLLTAALSLPGKNNESRTEAKNAVLAVAFLLDDDITDNVSDALVEAIATKTLSRLESTTDRLASSAAFLSATDTDQADATLTLKGVSAQLAIVTASLEVIATKISESTGPPPAQPQRTWASAAATATQLPPPSLPPAAFNPAAADDHTRLQQRVLRAARTILIEVDSADDTSPTDRSPAGNFAIREAMNRKLAELDKEADSNGEINAEGQSLMENTTLIRGITALERGAYIFEMDTADTARRFRTYAEESGNSLLTDHLGKAATLKAKAHNLIFRFVPCGGMFDPDNAEHLATIENDHNLPQGSIVSASWLKHADCRSKTQTVASLKVVCDSAEAANQLLQTRVFVAGHISLVRKDIREPIRCNKCQLYGHVRKACKNKDTCAYCGNTTHITSECTSTTPKCASCGPESTHASSARSCPTFKKLSEDLDRRFPENRMPYFPTGETWTWAYTPPKLFTAAPVHQPRIEPEDLTGPTEPTATLKPPARPPAGKAAPAPLRRQGTLNDFLVVGKLGSQREHRSNAAQNPSTPNE